MNLFRIGCALVVVVFAAVAVAAGDDYFGVRIIDDETGRGVPLVELRTVNDVSRWSDSAGWIAIREPALEGQVVFFHVRSHGYEVVPDGFGFRGVQRKLEAGARTTIKVKRVNLAERLYRVTGGGIYHDSVLLGESTPLAEPMLNARVFGSDSVLTAVLRGKVYWFWGDTNRPNYPLGNFHVPGAYSLLPDGGGLPIDEGVNLHYFVTDDGTAKATCRMPGEGPTWIGGLTVVADRMFAGYAKVKPPMQVYERGVVEWDDGSQQFRRRRVFEPKVEVFPAGHPVYHRDGKTNYVYFCNPLPRVRVPAEPDAIIDPDRYETYTYFAQGSTDENFTIARDDVGKLQWQWKADTIPPTRSRERSLIKAGQLNAREGAYSLPIAGSDRHLNLHTCSIAWNEHRQRWGMIALEVGGKSSFLGEVYYSESDSLVGAWSPAVKVVSHDRYSFYNPRLHPMFTASDGRTIYFEGTYTKMFSATKVATPRYDYNQIMYRLDLRKIDRSMLRDTR